MMEQMDIFAASGVKARLTKPLRLIELFAGYGSQRLSLKYLGVPCESWCVSEWATNSIRAYKDLHCGDANEDYAAAMTDDEIRAWMLGRISKDYNVPLTKKQIAKIKPAELRQIYNDMRNSRNLGSICLMHGSDLNIVDTDKYDYILTYSFPCQDLSTAGTMNGMHEGSGKRQCAGGKYHMAGDSILTTCLMALFGEALGVDYWNKIDELTKELKEEIWQ